MHRGDNNNVIGCCRYAALYSIKMVSYLICALHSEIKEWASQQFLNINKKPMWKHLTHHGHMLECGKTKQKPPNFLFVLFSVLLIESIVLFTCFSVFSSRSCQGYGNTRVGGGMLAGCSNKKLVPCLRANSLAGTSLQLSHRPPAPQPRRVGPALQPGLSGPSSREL